MVLAIFVGVMALVITHSASSPSRHEAVKQIADLEAQIEAVRQDNEALRESLQYHRSLGFAEATAKRDLNLIEPDDIQLTIDGPLPADPRRPFRAERAVEPPSPLPRFLSLRSTEKRSTANPTAVLAFDGNEHANKRERGCGRALEHHLGAEENGVQLVNGDSVRSSGSRRHNI